MVSSLLPPRYVGPERLYRGGTADVYSALDRELGRKVAIKILSEEFADDEQHCAWLRREAMAVARLSHMLEVVRVYDIGEWKGRPYMSMEYLGGGTLASRLKRGGITGELAVRWLWQAANAIDAAHDLGVVHRDVTPHNLLLDVRDNIRLTDFGIATAVPGSANGVSEDELIQGTGGFIAPEHLAGEPVTPASDVYALGAVARVLLIEAGDVNDRAPEVEAVLSRALASRPADRFPTAREFVSELASSLLPDATTTQVFHGAATQVFVRPTRVFPAPPPPDPKPIVQTTPLLSIVSFERAIRAAILAALGLGVILFRYHPEYSLHGTVVRGDQDLNPLQHAYDLVFGKVGLVKPHDLLVLGILALVSAAVCAVECVGLAYRVRWAVYLTVLTTVFLIPVEIWWLSGHPGRIKEIALAVNVAVALSLFGTLIRARFAERRARKYAGAAARASV